MSKKFAAFDIDGTLFRWQLYHELFDEFHRQGIISDTAASPVFAARNTWRERKGSYDTYELALVAAFQKAIVGRPEKVLSDAAEAILQANSGYIYRYTKDLLDSLKQKGYTILAISGSHQQLVERFAAVHGIDIVYGVQYKIVDGLVSQHAKTVFGKKATILRELVELHNLSWNDSYAIGDTHSDAAMLELVAHPIAFNPEKKLFEQAKKEGWKIVIERKNMIYELEQHGNTFVLAEAAE